MTSAIALLKLGVRPDTLSSIEDVVVGAAADGRERNLISNSRPREGRELESARRLGAGGAADVAPGDDRERRTARLRRCR